MHVPYDAGKRQRNRWHWCHVLTPVCLFLIGLMSSLAGVEPVAAQASSSAAYQPEGFILELEPGHSPAEFQRAATQIGLEVGRVWPEFGLAEVFVSGVDSSLRASGLSSQQAVLQTLNSLPGVLAAEPDATLFAADSHNDSSTNPSSNIWASKLDTPPTDSLLSAQWAYNQLDVWGAWTISQGDPNLLIAVIDSGYNVEHEDLSASNLWKNEVEENGSLDVDDDRNGFVDDLHGWDWVENDSVTNDRYGHGTHVGGTIAAIANNVVGVVGLGGSLQILPLRVLDERGAGQISDLIDAFYYAYQQDVRIVNLSLVLQFDSSALHQAIRVIHEDGMLLIAASGNLSSEVSWPARYSETVAVGATDDVDARGPFSNFGPEVDLAAPGVSILSTYLENEYIYQSGTSMAAAHVTALASLLWSLRPDLGAEEIRTLMQSTAFDANAINYPGRDEHLGAGRVDFATALDQASANLTVSAINMPAAGLYASEPLSVTVHVTVGGDEVHSVQGAVVQHHLLATPPPAPDGEVDGLAAMRVTDADGRAEIGLILPGRAGKYIWRLWVGASRLDLQLDVQERTAAVELVLPTTGLSVDASSVALGIEVFDADGQVAAESTAVHLETDLGRFDNGLQQIELDVVGGTHTFVFYPDRIAGDATLMSQVNGSVDAHHLAILPGEAAAIVPDGPTSFIANGMQDGEANIELALVDDYDNPVADGTLVHLATDLGELAETELVSVNGAVQATLAVQSGVDGPAHLWAVVPGTDATTRLDFPLLNRPIWLPIISEN